MDNQVRMKWLRFTTWKDAIDNDEGGYQFPCVYVPTERSGIPLYIGKATQKGTETRSGGLRERYYHDWTVLDACMEGTCRSIFLAEVNPASAEDKERQLIYENQPKYNKNGKIYPPENNPKLIHQGNPPELVT